MYMLPQLFGTISYAQPYDDAALFLCKEEAISTATGPADDDFKELFELLVSENHFPKADDFDSAENLYVQLRDMSYDLLFPN